MSLSSSCHTQSPAIAGLFFGSQPGHLMLTGHRRVRWSRYDFPRRNDETLNSFCRDKSTTAVDVCALMIPLFCGVRKIATRAGMGGVMAFRAVKHDEHL